MISETMMRSYLSDFLSPHGRQYDELVRDVDRVFGGPRLIVASGSVLQGFGNTTSDVDLHAVVADDRVTDFHLSFHDMGFAVDVNYVEDSWIDAAARDALGDPGCLRRPRTRAEWKEAERRLIQLGRFALGLPLVGDPDWSSWRQRLADSYARYAAWWWAGELLRNRTAAEIFAETAPLPACLRYCDAGLAALNLVAALAGEPYPSTKWLGPKLARSGQEELCRCLGEFLDVPAGVEGSTAYLSRARAALAALTSDLPIPDDPTVGLTPAPGVDVWQVRDRHLVHRFGLRGVELSSDVTAPAVTAELNWSGRLSELGDVARLLAANGLVWIACWEETS